LTRCVKSLRSSYSGLFPQKEVWGDTRKTSRLDSGMLATLSPNRNPQGPSPNRNPTLTLSHSHSLRLTPSHNHTLQTRCGGGVRERRCVWTAWRLLRARDQMDQIQACNLRHFSTGRGEFASASQEIGNKKSSFWSLFQGLGGYEENVAFGLLGVCCERGEAPNPQS